MSNNTIPTETETEVLLIDERQMIALYQLMKEREQSKQANFIWYLKGKNLRPIQ